MSYDKIFQEEMDRFIEVVDETALRCKLEHLLPLFAENLRRTLDHGDVDKDTLIRFYITMEAARARLVFENLGDDIIVKAITPGYTVACLMPRRDSGDPMQYEDFMKLMTSGNL